MTTTRHSEADSFSPFHVLPPSNNQYGPQAQLSRFTPVDPMMPPGELSFNGMPFAYPTPAISRTQHYPSLGAAWSSPRAPLPAAQGYGMGQDLLKPEAKRRRVDETAKVAVPPESTLSVPEYKPPSPYTAPAASYNSDPLLGDSSVTDWAGMGDFALFNDTHQDPADTSTQSDWASGNFIGFSEGDTRSTASTNNLFVLKESEPLFPTLERTVSAPAATDFSSFPEPSFDSVPAVATGRPLADYNLPAYTTDTSTQPADAQPVQDSPPLEGAASDASTSTKDSVPPAVTKPARSSASTKRRATDGSPDGSEHSHRPDLSQVTLDELNDISCFKNDERYKKLIVEYQEGISFPLGEGGRELLRACLNVKGCKGRQLQGASVPALLALAKAWGLWDVALRIKVERSCGQLCPQHDAFVKFKANQSQMRKYVKKEYMVTERDHQGCLSGIIYDERRKITLGKEGRESLRTQLRRLHDKHAGKMDDLLEKHGFKYSELRNATVQQLSRMAYVCNLWDKVVAACRKQEEKRDGRNRDTVKPTKASYTPRSDLSSATTPFDMRRAEETWTTQPAETHNDTHDETHTEPTQPYPSVHPYGDLPSHAYGVDDQQATKPDEQPDYRSLFQGDTSPEVRVKRELADTQEATTQKSPLSIEDLLSTLTVNWECNTNEPIEQFVRSQQERHTTPITEENLFRAFSNLVPNVMTPDYPLFQPPNGQV
eukprot:Blabericola_migrator_1__5470@NODE_2796_length_2342_cov_132_747253_g1752_i0_p1_GENE_NODE_2796_length_2342_cov_132_747253_g1752_i0NODE_2796_length_2342_cov_132_747253_g1752_i0_p1_ORF_typecomplete_len733_score163_39_NODE_2796_length_2342_cov_132_747253_g1752_i01422283